LKQDAGFFQDREAILIYIARRLNDAVRLEAVLTGAGVDYGVEADQYHGGVVFRRMRTGAFFYVLPDSLAAAREAMARHGFQPIVE
jgi:hypothetical protein